MSKKLMAALIIALSIVILLALQITANSFRAQSIVNAWVETAFQGSASAAQENDQIKLLSPAQSPGSSPDLVNKSSR
jgi:hypothetical protein